MLTKNFRPKCDHCGKFISFQDLDDGTATHLFGHGWDYHRETVYEKYDSKCKSCTEKENEITIEPAQNSNR